MSLRRVPQYHVTEIAVSPVSIEPTAAATLDVAVVQPDGHEIRVPAFVRDGEWRFRYSSGTTGSHRYRAVDPEPTSTENEDEIQIVTATDEGDSRSPAPVQVAKDRRHLERADGTPFLWLADTWWHGFTDRLTDAEFLEFAAKRVGQGFSVIQIVAGLYCEVPPFAPEARSTSGWVWSEGFGEPNLAWFEEADRRVMALLKHDLVPCIVGSWAYYLHFMEVSQMLRHWREMIARWGAYPVVWCLAGEPPLLWHDDESSTLTESAGAAAGTQTTEEALNGLMDGVPAVDDQLKRLNEVARGVRELEPFGRPVTIHSYPGIQPWRYLEDESVVDFWLLQTGHQGATSLVPSVDAIQEALAHEPTKPVINGESCYEGIAGSSWHDVQRFLFWTHMLSGTAGHSYGAHGIWAFNTPQVPGLQSGLAPMWKDAAEFPGASQLGRSRQFLLDLPWHQFEAHPEWVEPHQSPEDRRLPYAAGLEAGPRVFYFPGHAVVRNQLSLFAVRLCALGDRRWTARLIDPQTGHTHSTFSIDPAPDGSAHLHSGYQQRAPLPSWGDWLLILHTEPV